MRLLYYKLRFEKNTRYPPLATPHSLQRRATALAFLIALSFHALLFFLGGSFYQAPEYAIRQGNSNLEVGLVDAAAVEKNSPAASSDKINSAEIKKEASASSSNKFFNSSEEHQQLLQKKSSAASADKLIGTCQTAPSYLHNPQPTYPEAERISAHEGIVLLRVAIDNQGKVSKVTVEHSSGYLALDERALETVLHSWRFRPAVFNHEQIAAEIFIPIHFSLTSKKFNL